MAKIVIVGAGIGGIPMTFEMKESARKQDEVVVIADTPSFHFVPSLGSSELAETLRYQGRVGTDYSAEANAVSARELTGLYG
jgi:NADH dehydrogenase FAD-containing subunit